MDLVNAHKNLDTCICIDGSTGSDGVPTGVAEINRVVESVHSTFADTIPLTTQAQALPDIQGSEMVWDFGGAA